MASTGAGSPCRVPSCTPMARVQVPQPRAGTAQQGAVTTALPRAHLDAVVGGVGGTHQVLVGPAVQVRVLPADEPVARVACLALALVHGVAEVAQEDAVRVPVAAVRLVLARVLWLTHLRRRAGQDTQGPRPQREGPAGTRGDPDPSRRGSTGCRYPLTGGRGGSCCASLEHLGLVPLGRGLGGSAGSCHHTQEPPGDREELRTHEVCDPGPQGPRVQTAPVPMLNPRWNTPSGAGRVGAQPPDP